MESCPPPQKSQRGLWYKYIWIQIPTEMFVWESLFTGLLTKFLSKVFKDKCDFNRLKKKKAEQTTLKSGYPLI